MDLMATDTSAQRAAIEAGLTRQRLPFYSRFHTNGTAGIDVFSHNVNHTPGPLRKWFLLLPPECINDWEGAGIRRFRPLEVTKATSSGNGTT